MAEFVADVEANPIRVLAHGIDTSDMRTTFWVPRNLVAKVERPGWAV
jgi:hypothetical protein